MANSGTKELNISPSEVAKYFLFKALEDGDTVTPLRMQKLVYYAYCHVLVKNQAHLFNESIQAWINGPVIYSLYKALMLYGRSPIDQDFLGEMDTQEGFEQWQRSVFSEEVLKTLEDVYEQYMQYTPFELVSLTHREKPWLQARKGVAVNDTSTNDIADSDILERYQTA